MTIVDDGIFNLPKGATTIDERPLTDVRLQYTGEGKAAGVMTLDRHFVGEAKRRVAITNHMTSWLVGRGGHDF
jgi:hypothetical protein